MASSKKLPDALAAHVSHFLSQRVQSVQHLVLGLSGGLDSVVLLDLLAKLRDTLAFDLSAIHVNHQISSHSGEWASFCANLCQTYAVPLKIARVNVPSLPGDSLEAVARTVRYQALENSGAGFIVLAHHRDDQAETLLLQLLRGCGVDGASAMAAQNGRHLRPLLDISRIQLEHYARLHDLKWVEDESNQDPRFDRNFLRHHVLPVLKERFPAYGETLSRASRNFSENALIQEEMASHDAINAVSSNRLSIPALHRLSLPRAKNLLRHFLKRCGIAAPSAIRLEDMLHQLLNARQDARINIRLGAFELRRFLNHAWLIPVTRPHNPNLNVAWRGENELWLDEFGGSIKFRQTQGQGISQALLDQAPATLRLRQGGERLQLDCKRPHRSLKNLFQEAKIPPWIRQSLPMLYSGENLAAGIGIGIACAFQARPDEAGILLEWQTADGIVYS